MEMEMGMDFVGQAIVTDSLHKISQDNSYGIMELTRISDFEGVYRIHIPAAVIIGGVFVLIALVLSTLLILQHLQSYNNPAIYRDPKISVLWICDQAQMIIAAVAHIYVFPAEPYRSLPVPECGEVTSVETKTKLNVGEDAEGKPTIVKQTEMRVEAPGTSITESVQDVVLGDGELVVKDVTLSISQAIEPVQDGVTKIQETFHLSLGSDEEEGAKVEVDEQVTENVEEGKVHVTPSEKVVVKSND